MTRGVFLKVARRLGAPQTARFSLRRPASELKLRFTIGSFSDAQMFGQRHPTDCNLEMMMKSHSILMVMALILAVLVGTSPSYAKLISLTQNVSHSQLQSACNAAGGQFSDAPEGGGYACGTNCKGGKGTQCYVACDSGGSCVGQTPGRLFANVTLGQFLSGDFIGEVPITPEDRNTQKHNSPPAPQSAAPPSPAGAPVIE